MGLVVFGAELQPDEKQVVSEVVGISVEELDSVPLYARDSTVLLRNLQYLLEAIPQGQQERVAKEIGVRSAQLSRWKSGNGKPRKANLRKLLRHHNLDPDLDLENVPLFLAYEPISAYVKKDWVASRVCEMSPSDIAEIYPALKKLLRPDEKD